MSKKVWVLVEDSEDWREVIRVFESADAAKRWCATTLPIFQQSMRTKWTESKDVNGSVSYHWQYMNGYTLEQVPFGDEAVR